MTGSELLALFTYELWLSGVHVAVYVATSLAVLMIVVQIGWSMYRYVNDAEKEFIINNHHGNNGRDRKIFLGDFLYSHMPGKWPGSVIRADEVPLFYGFVLGYWFASIIGALIWPIVLVYGSVHGLLFGMRAAIRFKKKVHKALAKKADKGHTH
jgi:hypothetical protein